MGAQEEWITPPVAAAILSENSGHTVSRAYVVRLVEKGKLEAWRVNPCALLVKRDSVERYRVKKKGPPRQKQPA